jgi:hypothetical protein
MYGYSHSLFTHKAHTFKPGWAHTEGGEPFALLAAGVSPLGSSIHAECGLASRAQVRCG